MVKVKPVQNGRTSRMSFSRINEVIGMPNLIEIQKNSYNWFLDEGLREVFHDIDAIEDYTGNLSLEFVDYRLDKHPKYTIKECKERDATYAAPLYVTARLLNKSTGEVKEQEIFMGDFPLMTDSGTFISNGAERVIVSQLVRSPGVFYASSKDRTGKDLFTATMNPNRGAWLEYETDSSDVYYVRIDKNRKLPVTTFLRALGLGTDEQIRQYFGDSEPKINATLEKDITHSTEEALAKDCGGGGEDFHNFKMAKPSIKAAYFGVGVGATPGLHAANMSFDPKYLENGVKVFVDMTHRVLG